MKKNKGLILLMTTLFLLIGVSTAIALNYLSESTTVNKTIPSEDIGLYEKEIDQTTLKYIQTEIKNVSDLIILFMDSTSNDSIIEFKFKDIDELYEGVAYLRTVEKGWAVQDIDYMPVGQLIKPVTTRIMGGNIMQDNVSRPYSVISGVIKDENIKKIVILYQDQFDVIINIGEDQDTFFDVRRGYNGGLKTIVALDENENIIYSE